MLNLPQLNAAGGDTTINIIKSSPSNVNDQLVSGLTKTLTDIKQSISSVTKTNNDFKSFLKSTFNQKKEKGPKETSALDLEQQRKDEKLKEETNELLRDIIDALLKGYKIDKKKESEGFLSSILGSLGGMKWLNGLKLLGFAGLGAKLIALSDWFADINKNIGTKWTEVKEGFSKKLKGLSDWFKDIKTNVGTEWTEVKTKFSEKLKGLSDWFKDIKTNVGTEWTEVKKGFSEKLNGLSQWFDDIKTNVGTEWTEVKTKFSERLKGLNDWFKDIKTNVGTEWTEVKKGFSEKLNGLSQWFDDIKTNVRDNWSVIDDTFRTKLTKMSDWFGEVGTTLAKIKEFPVINEISKHLTRISDWFKGLGTIKLPKSPVPSGTIPSRASNIVPFPAEKSFASKASAKPASDFLSQARNFVQGGMPPKVSHGPANVANMTFNGSSSKNLEQKSYVNKGFDFLRSNKLIKFAGKGLGKALVAYNIYDFFDAVINPEQVTGKEDNTFEDILAVAISKGFTNFTPIGFLEMFGVLEPQDIYDALTNTEREKLNQYTERVNQGLKNSELQSVSPQNKMVPSLSDSETVSTVNDHRIQRMIESNSEEKFMPIDKDKQIDKDKLISYATKLIAAEEAFVPEAYPDGDRHAIGYGSQWMIDSTSKDKSLRRVKAGDRITEAEAKELLIKKVYEDHETLSKHPKVRDIYSKIQSPSRKIALLSMAYQLGVDGLIGFPKAWKKIKKANETNSSEDWKAVENELKMNSEGTDESDWIKQTRNRAERTSGIIGEGGVVSRDGVVFFDPNINKDIYVQGQANGGVANKAKVVAVGEYPGAKTNPELIVKLNELSSRMIETTKKIQELNREEMMANLDLIATATERRIVNTLESSRASQRRIAMAERNQNKVYPVQMPVTTSVVDNKTINNVTQPIFMQQGSEDRHNMYFRVG